MAKTRYVNAGTSGVKYSTLEVTSNTYGAMYDADGRFVGDDHNGTPSVTFQARRADLGAERDVVLNMAQATDLRNRLTAWIKANTVTKSKPAPKVVMIVEVTK